MSCHFQTLGKKKKKNISPPPIRIKNKNGKPSHFVSVSLYCALPVFALIVLVPLFPADYSAVSLVCVSKRSPRKKKTLWYSYRNQSNVIFESHPSRDRAEKNIKWSRTSRCGPASICRVHYVMDGEVGANKNSKQSRRK
jgi:hypothetical protein